MNITKKAPAKAAKPTMKKPAGYKPYSHSPGQDEDMTDGSKESLSGKAAPAAVTGKKAEKKAKAPKEKKPRAESAQGSVVAMLAAGATDEEIVAKLGKTFSDMKVPLAVKITRIRSRINRGIIKAEGIKTPLERKMRVKNILAMVNA